MSGPTASTDKPEGFRPNAAAAEIKDTDTIQKDISAYQGAPKLKGNVIAVLSKKQLSGLILLQSHKYDINQRQARVKIASIEPPPSARDKSRTNNGSGTATNLPVLLLLQTPSELASVTYS